MKKSILMIAVSALLVFSTISCNKDEKTGYDYLTEPKNGWKLTVAVSNPAYEMQDGTLVSDLITGFLESCERDDIMYFKTTEAQIIDPGKDKQTTNENYECVERSEKSLGNWKLSNDEGSFTSFYLPYFPGDNLGSANAAKIVTLNENTLTVNASIKDGTNNVIFTLTYTKQ